VSGGTNDAPVRFIESAGDAPNLDTRYNANPHSNVYHDSYYRNIR